MIGWFRVPLDAAKTLTGDHKATRMEATVDLLGRWHLGGNPGVRELMRAWDWSGDRVTKFVAEMRLWATENGAYLPAPNARPNKIGQQSDSDRTPSGQPDVGSTPEVNEQPDSNRTATGQAPDASCARGKEEEEETVDGRRDQGISAAHAAEQVGMFAHLAKPATPPANEPEPKIERKPRKRVETEEATVPKPPTLKALIIEQWHLAYLAKFGEKYKIEAVDAKRLHSLDHDRTEADLPELRAAFDTFFDKPFDVFPKGHTAMGFCTDPGQWIAASKRAAAGIVPVRNGRPVAPSYADTLRELEEMERAATTRNGAIDADYEVLQ